MTDHRRCARLAVHTFDYYITTWDMHGYDVDRGHAQEETTFKYISVFEFAEASYPKA